MPDVAGMMDLSDVSYALRIYAQRRIYHQFSNVAPIMYLLLPQITNQGFRGLRWQGTLHTGRNLSWGGVPEGTSYQVGDRPHEKYGEAWWDIAYTYIHIVLTAQMIERAVGTLSADDMTAQQFNGASDALLRLEHYELMQGDGSGHLAELTSNALDTDVDYYLDDTRMLEVGLKLYFHRKLISTGTPVGNAVTITAIDESYDSVKLGYKVTVAVTSGQAMTATDRYCVTTLTGYGQQLFGLDTHISKTDPENFMNEAQKLGNLTRTGNTFWQANVEDNGTKQLSYSKLKFLRDKCRDRGGAAPNFGVMGQRLWNAIGFGELASRFQTGRERLGPNWEALNFFGTRLIADDLVDKPTDFDASKKGALWLLNTRSFAYAWAKASATGLPINFAMREVAPGTRRVNRRIRAAMFHFVKYGGPRGGRLALDTDKHGARGTIFGWRQCCGWRYNGAGRLNNIKLAA